MTKRVDILLMTFLAWTACSNPTRDSTVSQSTEAILTESKAQKIADSTKVAQDKNQKETLPIHGELTQKQIDQYYAKILDTIKDRRIIGSEPIDIQTNADVYVSMLHNTGTSDQMFLCTHDRKFVLRDCYYVGTATTFDRTSHTIEYKKTADGHLEFHHVDWRYVKSAIDTAKHQKYLLTITKTGKIERK